MSADVNEHDGIEPFCTVGNQRKFVRFQLRLARAAVHSHCTSSSIQSVPNSLAGATAFVACSRHRLDSWLEIYGTFNKIHASEVRVCLALAHTPLHESSVGEKAHTVRVSKNAPVKTYRACGMKIGGRRAQDASSPGNVHGVESTLCCLCSIEASQMVQGKKIYSLPNRAHIHVLY